MHSVRWRASLAAAVTALLAGAAPAAASSIAVPAQPLVIGEQVTLRVTGMENAGSDAVLIEDRLNRDCAAEPYLAQDDARLQVAAIGLTEGGAIDFSAAAFATRLCVYETPAEGGYRLTGSRSVRGRIGFRKGGSYTTEFVRRVPRGVLPVRLDTDRAGNRIVSVRATCGGRLIVATTRIGLRPGATFRFSGPARVVGQGAVRARITLTGRLRLVTDDPRPDALPPYGSVELAGTLRVRAPGLLPAREAVPCRTVTRRYREAGVVFSVQG